MTGRWKIIPTTQHRIIRLLAIEHAWNWLKMGVNYPKPVTSLEQEVASSTIWSIEEVVINNSALYVIAVAEGPSYYRVTCSQLTHSQNLFV